MEKTMNKFLVYTVIAILLGTVTMTVPLALLGPYDTIPEGNYNVSEANGGTLERNDMLASPKAPIEPLAPETFDAVPEKPEGYEITLSETDVALDLSSIGLMIVPSFLIALGAFVYLKKRMV